MFGTVNNTTTIPFMSREDYEGPVEREVETQITFDLDYRLAALEQRRRWSQVGR